jgi:hypothetical protein
MVGLSAMVGRRRLVAPMVGLGRLVAPMGLSAMVGLGRLVAPMVGLSAMVGLGRLGRRRLGRPRWLGLGRPLVAALVELVVVSWRRRHGGSRPETVHADPRPASGSAWICLRVAG